MKKNRYFLGGKVGLALMVFCGLEICLCARVGANSVNLRDAEGYEIPGQGWVKAPSFMLDQGAESFSPTVMDIADTADFDNATTWSLTEQGGELLIEFVPGQNACAGLVSLLRFGANDKYASYPLYCPFSAGVANVQTGQIVGSYGISSANPGGLCFRHGTEELIVWGNKWAPEGLNDYSMSEIFVYDVQTKALLKSIGVKGGLSGTIEWSTMANVDGSRLYVFANNRLGILDIDTEQIIKTYYLDETPCQLSKDGTRLMVWNADASIDLIDTKTDEIVYTFDDLSPIEYLNAASGNHNVMIVFTDGTVNLLNTEKATPVMQRDIINTDTLRLSRDGTRVGKITDDGTMHLWDLELKNDLDFSGPGFEDFSHDGSKYAGVRIASTYSDRGRGQIVTMPPQIRYASEDLTNGPRTLYVRLRDDAGTSQVLTYQYSLDTVAPGQPGQPVAGGGQDNGRVTFTWSPTDDNAGGGGVANYEFIAESAEGLCDEHHAFSEGGTNVTIPCATGQTVYFRVRAIDAAGNAGEWSETAAYYVNAAPEAPQLTLNPDSPGTLDTVTVNATSTDPEGDDIIDTGAQWYLDGVMQSEADTLDPSLTVRGQVWKCRARVRDFHGAWSDFSEQTFTIVNTPPSQPLVEIKPDPASADSDLIVDILQYSIDPDGDEVDYDFTWFKSTDGGETWIHKVELDGLPQVSNMFINEGELWRVQYTPYEKNVEPAMAETDTKDADKAPVLNRVDGCYAWDQIFVGDNQPPVFTFQNVQTDSQYGGISIDVDWTATDPDGDDFNVNLYYFDTEFPLLKPLADLLDQQVTNFQGTIPVTDNMTFRLVAIVTDAKGSMTQVVSGEQAVKTAILSNWTIYR